MLPVTQPFVALRFSVSLALAARLTNALRCYCVPTLGNQPLHM